MSNVVNKIENSKESIIENIFNSNDIAILEIADGIINHYYYTKKGIGTNKWVKDVYSSIVVYELDESDKSNFDRYTYVDRGVISTNTTIENITEDVFRLIDEGSNVYTIKGFNTVLNHFLDSLETSSIYISI